MFSLSKQNLIFNIFLIWPPIQICPSKSSVYLCLDNSIVSSSASFVTALEQQLPACPCIRALSLRDNSLEHETFRLLTVIGQMPGIRALDIGGGNFIGLKVNKKHAQILAGILSELVKLVNENDEDEDDEGQLQEGAFIEDLSLSDSRLGSHLGVLLNALGLCRSLKRLDLSYCKLGPGGARLLGKSLQLNQSLRHLSLDRNQNGPDGFLELARALRFNFTLLHLQLPTIDLSDAMAALARSPIDRSRLQMIMAEIEQSLERNGQLRAADGPTQAQLAMQTVHSLINRCDRYDVNGPEASEVKKIAFHKLGKLVAGMGDEEEMTTAENAEQNGSNGGGWPVGREPDGSVAGDKRARLVEHLAERIEQMAAESGKNFLRQFAHRLSAQEGVQMAVGMEKEGDGNLANGTLMENGSGNENNAQHGNRLRQELNLLIQKYTQIQPEVQAQIPPEVQAQIPPEVQSIERVLQETRERFQAMSDQIINRIDDMASHVDTLEKSITELMVEAVVELDASTATAVASADDGGKDGPRD